MSKKKTKTKQRMSTNQIWFIKNANKIDKADPEKREKTKYCQFQRLKKKSLLIWILKRLKKTVLRKF